MNKKFISAVMAGAMAVSALSVSAFAADTTQQLTAAGEKTLKATAAFAPVAIDVTLPTSITAAINPYKIDYDFSGDKAGTSGVVSPIYEIVNNTADYGVKVGAKVSATPSKTVTVATVDKKTKAAPVFKNDNTEDKTVFAYLNTTVEADKSFANDTYTADDDTQILFTEDMPDNAVVLMQIAKGGKSGYFQIQGDCVEEPAEKWTKDDSVELSIVFDINPFNDSAETVATGPKFANASDVTLVASGSATAITFTFNPNTLTYNLANDLDATGGRLDLTVGTVTGATVAVTADNTVLAYNAGNGRVTANSTGSGWVKITVTDDTDNTKVTVYTINIAVT